MKLLTLIFLGLFVASAFSQSKSRIELQAAPYNENAFQGNSSRSDTHPPTNLLGVPIPISGAVDLGLEGAYQEQSSYRRAVHNIIVDPDQPNNLHAVIQFPKGVTENDTTAGKDYLPQLRVYYIFSSDDGKTWSTPKPIANARMYNAEMTLLKRGTENVPVIAALRTRPDTAIALYIEQGAPGTGDFAEFKTDNKTFRGNTRFLDYPSIAVSHSGTKIFMTSGINNNDDDNPQYIQFGTFTLSTDQKSATWGGWAAGPSVGTPGAEDARGFAYSWSAALRVSQIGKLGIMWVNRDFQTPDLSTYLSESTDEGTTWLAAPKTVVAPLATTNDPYTLVPFHFDFWYSAEKAEAALAGYYYNRDSAAGFYIPASGSLLFWKDGNTAPVLLLSKENDTELGTSLLDPTFLSAWTNASGSPDPQFLTNLNFPTVARTSNANVFSIYFSAWQDGDVQDITEFGENPDPKFTSLPYFGIWKTYTLDGGTTFSEADMVHGNDLANPGAQYYDYRSIRTAPWNPGNGLNTVDHIMFNVDTIAGAMIYGGYPGFDEVTWLFEKTVLAGVPTLSDSKPSTLINYPNPFIANTTLPVSLAEAQDVSLIVTNAIGQEIARKNYGKLSSGEQSLIFDAKNLSTGSCPYVLHTGSEISRGVFKIVK